MARPTPRSIRRIVEQVTSHNGTRNGTAYAFAAIVHAVLADAVHQPVSPLRSVSHQSVAERVYSTRWI